MLVPLLAEDTLRRPLSTTFACSCADASAQLEDLLLRIEQVQL